MAELLTGWVWEPIRANDAKIDIQAIHIYQDGKNEKIK
jgi:hypothetical protein